ncbi:MAG: NADH-ubiquinone oxidoreductase-F iron-sulfur binding region domain-containing protein [Syntrophobacteraceae bacterium]|nr:hypothetical protein [Desulfobacteraceae bacterium]
MKRNLRVSLGNAKIGCSGSCAGGPFVGFPQQRFSYRPVRPEDVPRIIGETVVNGRLLPDLLGVGHDRSYRSDLVYDKASGVIGALDEGVCMVEAAKYFVDFEEGLSCGKCTPCRIGLKRLQEALERVFSGEAAVEELEEIRRLCRVMIDAPYCDFAAASSGPVLSALNHFENEFRAHVQDLRCLAGACEKHLSVNREERLKQKAEAAEKRRIEEAERAAKAEKAEAAKKSRPAESVPTAKAEKPTVEGRAAEAAVVEPAPVESAKEPKPDAPAKEPKAGRPVKEEPAEESPVVETGAVAQTESATTAVAKIPEGSRAVAVRVKAALPVAAERRDPVKSEPAKASSEDVVTPAPEPSKPVSKGNKQETKASAAAAPARGSKAKSKPAGKKKKSGGRGKSSKG